MSKRLADWLKVLIGVALSAILLYAVFRNVDWAAFWSKAKVTDLSWVVYSILLSIVAYIARAYRWNILLEPLGHKLTTPRTTLAVLVGYLANLAIPRLGELTRCGILKRNDNVPMPQSIGSVITERIIDFLTLVLLFVISLLVEYDILVTFLVAAYKNLNLPGYFFFLLLLILFVSVFTTGLFIRKNASLKNKFKTLVHSFLEGLLSLRNIKRPVGFLLSTAVLWIVYYLMSYLIVFSIPETSQLGPWVGFILLVTGGIAISIPVQSGFGTYHGMIAGMLVLYGIDKTTGLFLATLLHTSQIVAVAIFGSLALVITSFLRKKQNLAD